MNLDKDYLDILCTVLILATLLWVWNYFQIKKKIKQSGLLLNLTTLILLNNSSSFQPISYIFSPKPAVLSFPLPRTVSPSGRQEAHTTAPQRESVTGREGWNKRLTATCHLPWPTIAVCLECTSSYGLIGIRLLDDNSSVLYFHF